MSEATDRAKIREILRGMGHSVPERTPEEDALKDRLFDLRQRYKAEIDPGGYARLKKIPDVLHIQHLEYCLEHHTRMQEQFPEYYPINPKT